ncbi:TPA: YadA-like family protein, partial [Salmonella enterica subsp. enterica serovar Java]
TLKSTRFTLPSLALVLYLSSNMAYADNLQLGNGANASGYQSTAIGMDAQAAGTNSAAIGAGANASGYQSTAIGMNAQAAGTNSTATGNSARAIGHDSTATGVNAYAKGLYSTATGEGTQATGAYSVALGAGSRAKNDNEVNIGIWQGVQQIKTRTLSGLADGKNSDEAVNKGQLDSAKAAAISHSDDNLATAKEYTKTEIGNVQNSITTAKDEAVSKAGENTDTKIKSLNIDNKFSNADQQARQYASKAEDNANKYTDEQIGKIDTSGVLNKARDYTNDTAKQTLKSANENTENRAVVAENNAVTRSNAYTDESSVHTLKSANTYTNHRAEQAENNAVARSNAYTDNRFGELRKNLEHTEKRLNAGIAGVTALSSIPYVAGNKFSYGIGAGTYQNGNAVAAGVQFRVSPSTNVRLNISWDSAGNNATGVGIAGGW